MVDGPQVMDLPLWRGEDTQFTARRTDPITGAFIPYDSTTTAKIIFTSGKDTIEFDATIEGDSAKFVIDNESVANVRNNATWRLQFYVDGRAESPVVGKVVRKDA